MTLVNDPLFQDKPAPQTRSYFGQLLSVTIADVIVMKGAGKIPFDPNVHDPNSRRTSIDFKLLCVTKDGSVYYKDLSDLSFGKKWARTRASLIALGVNTREQILDLQDKYVHVKVVPSGGKYLAKRDASDGSFKAGDPLDEMTWEFCEIFASKEAMDLAQATLYQKPKPAEAIEANTATSASQVLSSTTSITSEATDVPNNLDRTKVLALQAILGTVQNNVKAFEERMKELTFIATPDAPEYKFVVASAANPIPF
jgi:hypothetical protein